MANQMLNPAQEMLFNVFKENKEEIERKMKEKNNY